MATLEELQKIAKRLPTGLVPMRVTRSFMPYSEGQIAGFPPDQAFGYQNAGHLEVYRPKKGDENDPTLGANGPAVGSHAAVNQPGPPLADARVTPYDRRPEVTPRAQTAPVTALDPNAPALPKATGIPENWQELPTAERRQLAANLSGRRYQELSAAASDEIIARAIEGEPAPAVVESNLEHGELGTTEGAGVGPVAGADAD